MSAEGSAGDSRRHPVVLDLTRIDDLKDAKKIFLNIRDEDNVSVLVDSDPVYPYIFDTQTAYNLYGYTEIDFKGNTFINCAIDLARMSETYLNKGDKNRYSNYKYANFYPLNGSNWNKFSRFKLNYSNYTILPRIYTNDFYSFLSAFDGINQYRYNIYIEFKNSNYKDFIDSNPNSNEYVDDKPVQYHGRNIYMDKNFIYLKADDAMDLYKLSNVVACKYMVVELDGPVERPVALDGAFSLCNTHAYIINTSTNKLRLKPIGLLHNCKATKFGDISDARTILNITDQDVSLLCSDSNVEDMSMHTIKIDSSAYYINIHHAFSTSKIKKLPTGFVESLGRGFKSLQAGGLFSYSKNFEIDISKINIPTLGSSPSTYRLGTMYKGSNCRHINRSIISRNNRDEIYSDEMYMDTTLIEDTPLPDGMFKNYKNFDKIFDGVTFETANTFKYIYGEFAKTEIKYESSGSKKTPQINNINIINNIKDYKIIIGSGEDYEKTNLIPFTIYPDNITGSEMIRLSILGNKREDVESSNNKKLYAVGGPCRELSFGFRMDDLKRAADIGYKQYTSDKYFITNNDFKYHFIRNNIDSLKPDFFSVIAKPIDVQVFRRLSILLYGDDYYNRFNYIFDGAFRDRSSSQSGRDEYKITSVLYSNTLKSINMISLDEIISKNLLSPIIQRRFDNACAIINTNGKNLKWTLSEYHYNTHNRMEDAFGARTSYGVPHFYNYISVFTNAVYLYRAINAQMYFTKDFSAEKIEFIFRANDQLNLVRFLALMSLYMDPNDPKKPVGRFILIHNGNIYDSKTNMSRINALATFNQSHIDEIKTNVDEYDDGFLIRG